MTDAEHEQLNKELFKVNRVVVVSQRDGADVYTLCKFVPMQEITDIASFAEAYGVVVSQPEPHA